MLFYTRWCIISKMNSDYVKNKKLYVPQRAFGVCIWIMADGKPLSDGDGVLCAEGIVGDKSVEEQVRKAALYWTGSEEGYATWVGGARKVTASEKDDQAERLANGLMPDPYEDIIEAAVKKELNRRK
jgi:hypothetical protein